MDAPTAVSTCKNCGIDIWWDEADGVWLHDEHEGETCGFVSPQTVAEPSAARTYPITFESRSQVKIIASGGASGIPIEISLDTSKMTKPHIIEVTPEGEIKVTSEAPFIEIPDYISPEDEDAYVEEMTAKYDATRAEFLREMSSED